MMNSDELYIDEHHWNIRQFDIARLLMCITYSVTGAKTVEQPSNVAR